ncbi:hypothetical protein [Trinickia fusca]|uniref:Bulb-type lectin domain-containing protein n=1 Tax=Trinickia fusca TaxID=2419777 RepID=A0A494XLK2_9BURK|nr:hypothetical protein [Trinickia fusca]RKP50621.1 hypothetical protein D7S89_05835 [Trinickia fusca]
MTVHLDTYGRVLPAADTTPPISTPPASIHLFAGQKLLPGQCIRSSDGRFELDMQKDGNLVEYDLTTHVAVWDSKTDNSEATVAVMQKDGNLVLDKVDPDTMCVTGKNAVWSSHTDGNDNAFLTLQPSGELTVESSSASTLWHSGVPLPEVPPPQQPIAQPSTPPDADANAKSAVGLFTPGQGEAGLKQYPLAPGQSPYSLFKEHNLFAQPDLTDSDPVVNANLAATPTLDPQAFGSRPANPPDAAKNLQVGQPVTILDPTRLQYLETQRSQLQQFEHATRDAKDDLRDELTATIYQELDYAGTQQSVPDTTALAASIRARAPQDTAFQNAVDDAVKRYDQTLQTQGRTSDMLGRVNAAASSGDWAHVRSLVADQITSGVGKDEGSTALGDITARASVYLTYAGGDPKFAQAVQSGIADAQHTVLVDRPVQAVVDAYHTQGAGAAMDTLSRVTDPQTATMAQVGQIMADPRVQQTVKQVLGDVAAWQGDDKLNPTRVMQPLSAACQHAIESDGGHNGLGKQAVDAIATNIVAQADGTPPGHGLDVFQSAPLTQQMFADAARQGNVALAFAVGAQAKLYRNPMYASGALDGARQGLDAVLGSVGSLKKKIEKDGAFIGEPLATWGGDSTPEQQSQLIDTLLAENSDDAKKLEDDSGSIPALQETVDGAQSAIQAYGGELKGVEGFDTDVPTKWQPGQYQWSVSGSPSITKAFDGIGKLGLLEPSNQGEPTNTLWLQRSMRKVYEQLGKRLIAGMASGSDAILSAGGAKLTQSVWSRLNKGVGAVLYFQNAAYTLGNINEGGLLPALQNGASGIRQDLGGISYALAAGIPNGKLDLIRPKSGETPLAKSYKALVNQLDGLDLTAKASGTLKVSLKLAMQNTSDFASAILGLTEAAQNFHDGKTIQGVGNLLNAAGYAALLTGPGIDASELPAGARVLGLAGDTWDLIGGPAVAVAAILVTSADAYDHSHEHDGNDAQMLKAMGVKGPIADQLAKHATSFDGAPPSAGAFLTAYFKNANASQDEMVAWLNTLSPHDADAMASALKAGDGLWQKEPIAQASQQFDDALLNYGIMPPVRF